MFKIHNAEPHEIGEPTVAAPGQEPGPDGLGLESVEARVGPVAVGRLRVVPAEADRQDDDVELPSVFPANLDEGPLTGDTDFDLFAITSRMGQPLTQAGSKPIPLFVELLDDFHRVFRTPGQYRHVGLIAQLGAVGPVVDIWVDISLIAPPLEPHGIPELLEHLAFSNAPHGRGGGGRHPGNPAPDHGNPALAGQDAALRQGVDQVQCADLLEVDGHIPRETTQDVDPRFTGYSHQSEQLGPVLVIGLRFLGE